LSELHKEYSQLRYVFDICRRELQSSNTPLNTKIRIKPKIEYLEDKLYLHFPIQTNSIPVRYADSPTVMHAKIIANKVLNFNFTVSVAWRVNYAEVFEKFVQYVFKSVAREQGGKLLTNYKLKGRTFKLSPWQLSHLEPDAIFQKDNILVFIDAKYKSHLYNKYDVSEILKNEHRLDLHQILAYTSFSRADTKVGILCYPSVNLEIKEIEYCNPINLVVNQIKILGLPLKIEILNDAKKLLIDEMTNLEIISKN
jgi:McrBC 5-methylcytosine restriction system component